MIIILTDTVKDTSVETDLVLTRKCMYMISAARIADTIAAGAKKNKGAASSIQETIMSVFRKHAGVISGEEKSSRTVKDTMKNTVKGAVNADERICC